MSYAGYPYTPQPVGSPYQPISSMSSAIANALLAKQLRDRLQPDQLSNASLAANGQLSNSAGSWLNNQISGLFGLGSGASGK